MNKQALRADFLLLLTAAIWGFAFVAQRAGMEYLGPFTFNGIRFLLGSFSLTPLVLLRLRFPKTGTDGKTGKPGGFKSAAVSSLLAGTCLFIAASLQQVGIIHTTAGNSGFITGFYVVLTPIAAMVLGKKTGLPTWIGAGFTVTGMFFLSVAGSIFETGSPQVNPGDLITALGALFWTCHVLVIDNLVKRIDPILLSAGQFACCGLFSLAVSLGLGETFSLSSLMEALIPILYGGLCSVGIAYTLQVVAQKYAPPAHATILLSLEGVFAVIGGVLLLGEPLGSWTLLGFSLMFCGMLATQWEVIRGTGSRE